MTMNLIWNKLRKKNKENYRQFCFCIGFAVMLISSYLILLYSPLIQQTLPIGGDSRKQIYMILGLALTGCTIFILYATGLFLRYKSREVGVFLALGTEKSKVMKALLIEIAKIAAVCSILGIAAGSVAAFLLGNVIGLIAAKAAKSQFAFSVVGAAASWCYVVFVFLIIMILSMRFIRRSNLIDIMNEQRKSEPIRKMVSRKYLITGILCLIVGLLTAFILPGIVTRLTNHWMGSWTNLFYLLVLFGLYRIMVYSIACHKKGRNPQKYYKNVISYGMLKFAGSSIVRNMLVITLLIMGSIFAMFYMPLNSSGKNYFDQCEAKYSYRYPENADEITKEELESLAENYDIEILNYREAEFSEVLGSGMERENWDKNGNLIKKYHEQYAIYECISTDEFKRTTGKDVTVADGTYYLIQSADSTETIWKKFNDMDRLYLKDEISYLPMKYAGNVTYQSFVLENGYGVSARYLVSSNDYAKIREGAGKEQLIRQVLFDTENGNEVSAFSSELYKKFALMQSDNMKVCGSYDSWQQKQKGDKYGYGFPAIYDPENSIKETEWQYKPIFVFQEQKNFYLSSSVYFLLFLYVAVICLAAVGIISYTRSQSVGTSNRQIFMNIERLGASHDYLRKLLKQQVKKIYVLPTAIGCIGMFLFVFLLLYGNDALLRSNEISLMFVALALELCVVLYQYIVYQFSMKKVTKILRIRK